MSSANSHFQFGLRDLLGLMAAFGACAWMARILMREQVWLPWVGTLLSAAVAVAITLAMLGLLRGPRRVVSGAILLLVVGASAGYFHWLHRVGARALQYIVGAYLGEELFWRSGYQPQNMLVLLLIFSLFLAVLFAALRMIQPKEAPPRGRWARQVFSGVAFLAWLLPMSWLYWQLLSYPQPPARVSNRPNALPLLLARGQALESLSPAKSRTVSAEVVRLSKEPGFVSVPWEADLMGRRNYDENMLVEVQAARSITRGLDAQATALEATDPDLAADHLMAIIRIGGMLEREGLLVHGLVGISLGSVGEQHLARLRRRLSTSKAREILAELKTLEKSRHHDDIDRDQLWYSLNERWAFRLYQILISGSDAHTIFSHYGVVSNRNSCLKRLLMIDLALRAYQADHGVFPSKLESLAPRYINEVPLDPFSEKPFVYRLTAKDFVLYSVGGDRVDNGARFLPEPPPVVSPWEGYDLNLDPPRK